MFGKLDVSVFKWKEGNTIYIYIYLFIYLLNIYFGLLRLWTFPSCTVNREFIISKTASHSILRYTDKNVFVQQCPTEGTTTSITEKPSESQNHVRTGCKLFNMPQCLVDSEGFWPRCITLRITKTDPVSGTLCFLDI
jgi:hypothetical protein